MESLRSAGAHLERFRENEGRLPRSLAEAGVPVRRDGWGTELEFAVRGGSYAIRSAGACGVFEETAPFEYRRGATDHFADDIVFVDGAFVSWPEGVQH